jgi:hypothetical protein
MSTTDHPIAPPLGLVDALDDQLDVVSIPGLPTIELFENRAWIPAISELGGATAEASLDEGAASLVRADLTDATAVFPDADPLSTSTSQLQGGVVHLAVPYDDQWKLTVDGVAVESRPSFGIATAFDAPSGMGELRYETGGGRTFLVVLQTALWLLVLFGATRVSLPFARRRIAAITDETLIDLDDDSIPIGQFETHVESAPVAAGILRDPGLDATGELARPPANDDEVAEVDPPTDDGERP